MNVTRWILTLWSKVDKKKIEVPSDLNDSLIYTSQIRLKIQRAKDGIFADREGMWEMLKKIKFSWKFKLVRESRKMKGTEQT